MIRAVNLDDPEYEVVTVAGSKETEGFRDSIGKGDRKMHSVSLFLGHCGTDDITHTHFHGQSWHMCITVLL